MSNLTEFQQRLETIIGRPTDQRPFVCDGSPLDCRVFIVGLNPASASERDFWEFWDCEAGFNKRAWFESYLAERAKRPFKPGKTRRNLISNTRRVLEWVISSAGDTRILETNIYASATEDAKDLAGRNRQKKRNKKPAAGSGFLCFISQKLSPGSVSAPGWRWCRQSRSCCS